MLLFSLNLATAGTPDPTPAPTPPPVAASPHGFEMVGRKRAKDYVRDAVLARIEPEPQPVKKQDKKKAEVIVLKAAQLVAEGKETALPVLQRQWLALRPVLASNVDPSEAFWQLVAKRLREIEEDEEEALLLLL